MATFQSFQSDLAQFDGPTTTESISVSTGPSQAGPVRNIDPVHNIEGRVGKSGRKRSRSSRRAPTTLLSTDPTNFRAMVQQFTGAPSGPGLNRAEPVVNFGYRSNPGQTPVQYQRQQQQQQQQQQSQSQMHSNMQQGGGIGNKGFVQGFNYLGNDGSSSSKSNGVFFDGMGAAYANQSNGGYLL